MPGRCAASKPGDGLIFGHDVLKFLSYARLKACNFKACNKAKMSGEDKRA
jgi:hypothetical protein